MKLYLHLFSVLLLGLAQAVTAAAAHADWREEMGRMRIGVAQQISADRTTASLEPFRLAIEEKLGLTVELVSYANLSSMARAQAGGRLEYAIYPATTYAAVWLNCECVEPLVVAAAEDGSTSAASILISRNGAGVSGLANLSGRQVWLLQEGGVLTHRYALHAMANSLAGFDETSIEWLQASNPREAIERFVKGEGHALIGWSSLTGDASTGYSRGTAKQIAEVAGSLAGYPIVWRSQPLSNHVHAIRKNIDGEAKSLLREVLARMEQDDPVAYDAVEPVYSGGFQPAPQSGLASAISFVRSLLPEEEEASPVLDQSQIETNNDETGEAQ